MKITAVAYDIQILKELGNRITRYRLDMSMTQKELSKKAGVSKSTLERLEAGSGAQILNLIKILRVLGLTENLNHLLPEQTETPMELLHRQQNKTPKPRQRATPPKPQTLRSPQWKWSDES